MASSEKVKAYLACWFQLGKRLISQNGKEIFCVDSVLNGDRYSTDFEVCWQKIMDRKGKNHYLEGTEQTIEQLLSPKWNVSSCARCNMPVPKLELGMQSLSCPCVDIPSWPNLELPLPRSPIDSNFQIAKIRDRLGI